MNQGEMKSGVLIVGAESDGLVAASLSEALAELGVSAKTEIAPDIADPAVRAAAERAIHDAALVIWLASNAALASRWSRWAAQEAVWVQATLLPLLIEDVDRGAVAALVGPALALPARPPFDLARDRDALVERIAVAAPGALPSISTRMVAGGVKIFADPDRLFSGEALVVLVGVSPSTGAQPLVISRPEDDKVLALGGWGANRVTLGPFALEAHALGAAARLTPPLTNHIASFQILRVEAPSLGLTGYAAWPEGVGSVAEDPTGGAIQGASGDATLVGGGVAAADAPDAYAEKADRDESEATIDALEAEPAPTAPAAPAQGRPRRMAKKGAATSRAREAPPPAPPGAETSDAPLDDAPLRAAELEESVPRRMTRAVPTHATVRIAFKPSDNPGLGAEGVRHEIRAARIMSIRLEDPHLAYDIREQSQSSQFVDPSATYGEGAPAFAEWRFTLTPLKSGRHPLVIRPSALLVGAGGHAHVDLDPIHVEPRVAGNVGKTVASAFGAGAMLVLGGALGRYGEALMAALERALK